MPSHGTTPETAALLSPQLLAQARSDVERTGAAHARSPQGHQTRYAAVGYHDDPQVIQPTG